MTANSQGRVICFVSAKGGSGKTILTATTAYLLIKAGKRVLTIDTDFSTRGITLYFMGSEARTRHLEVTSENCLSEALLGEVPLDGVKPKSFPRGPLRFELLLSSLKAWTTNMPDDRIVGDTGGDRLTSAAGYFGFLQPLLERFRKEYEYIFIDTRGGYDFTSAAPALLADGYVIVLEADQISVQQVFGLKGRIEELGERHSIRPALSGFVVNKAIHSIDDRSFPDTLVNLYGGAYFGSIPLDREAVRAYQARQIPTDVRPDSDFAYHSYNTLERIISPSLNWDLEESRKFYEVGREIETLWKARRAWQFAQSGLPVLVLLLALATAISYFFIRNTTDPFGTTAFYFCLALFVLASTSVSVFILIQSLRTWRISPVFRILLAVYGVASAAGLFWMTFVDVQKTFSRDTLSARVAEQNKIIVDQENQIANLSASTQDLNRRLQFASEDKNRLEQQLTAAQARLRTGNSDSVAVKFQSNDALLRDVGVTNSLAGIGKWLKDNPTSKALVLGLSAESENGGPGLAQARAKSVADFLTKFGARLSQLSIQSKTVLGDASNDTSRAAMVTIAGP